MKNNRPEILLVNRCFIFDKDKNILIIKRSANDRKDPNKWEIPGGKLDKGEDLISSKNREVKEETGLTIQQINPMVFANSYVIEDGGYKDFTYISIFSINKVKKGKVKISDEHSEYSWVNYNEMLKRDLTKEVRKAAVIFKNLFV